MVITITITYIYLKTVINWKLLIVTDENIKMIGNVWKHKMFYVKPNIIYYLMLLNTYLIEFIGEDLRPQSLVI